MKDQTDPVIKAFNLSKKQIEVINKNFKSIDSKISELEESNYCLCKKIIKFIFLLILYTIQIFIILFALNLIYSLFKDRVRYINYAPEQNLSWKCYKKDLNIPIVTNPYFYNVCDLNFIQCNKQNRTVYKNMDNNISFTNYTHLIQYGLITNYNCINYKSNIYLNNYLNHYIAFKTYTTYNGTKFIFNIDLNCIYNEVNLFNSTLNKNKNSEVFGDYYFSITIKEFSKVCESELISYLYTKK
jgi:hypothetical protein